jgi:hypothetical protein
MYANHGDNITLFRGINSTKIIFLDLSRKFGPNDRDTFFTITERKGIETYKTNHAAAYVHKFKFQKHSDGAVDVIFENVSRDDSGEYFYRMRFTSTILSEPVYFNITVSGKSPP